MTHVKNLLICFQTQSLELANKKPSFLSSEVDYEYVSTKDFDMYHLMGSDLQIEIDHCFFSRRIQKHLLSIQHSHRIHPFV